jgi:large subunit ribosomal protein L23
MAIFGDKKKEKKEKVVRTHRAHSTVSLHGKAHDVIRAPWFSEKALLATEKGVYAFAVRPEATKPEIAGAIKEIFNVTPKAVRIVNLPAKKKAMRSRRGMGTRAARTKAYVYLNAGDSIQFA